jgi:hypothetical protein
VQASLAAARVPVRGRGRAEPGVARRAAVVEIAVAVVVVIVVVSLSCRSQTWSWSWRWSRSRGAWHGSGGHCCCCSQGEEKKRGGGLTFCRVVGSAGACYERCSSPPLLQTATLAGPSWAATGASLCLRSCSRVRRSSRQWGGEAWTAHQIECALSRQTREWRIGPSRPRDPERREEHDDSGDDKVDSSRRGESAIESRSVAWRSSSSSCCSHGGCMVVCRRGCRRKLNL